MRRIEITFWRALERWICGLDKTYRLHKCLGISGLALAITHWLWSEGPKWARVAVARTPGARRAARPGIGNAQRPINLANSHE